MLTSLLFLFFSAQSQAKLIVGTTTTDLEAIVKVVGGDRVETFSIAKGSQDPHQIEAKPSYMLKFRNADLVIAQGLELESAWLTPLIQGSRNPKITAGGKGVLELGSQLDPIEVSKEASRAEGDIHPGGNPHFQLDPIRLGKAAMLIADRLIELDSTLKDSARKNAAEFQNKMNEKTKQWQARIQKSGIKEVVTYHKTLSYFLNRFGIKGELQLEPKPGIPPTASHILSVIDEMQKRKIRLVLIENFFDDSIKRKLEHEVVNVKIFRIAVSVGGEPNINTNEDLIEQVVKTFEAAGYK